MTCALCLHSNMNIVLLEEVVTYNNSIESTFCVHLHCWLMIYAVPTTPTFDVCAVYDTSNGALQFIESTWMEVVCCV